jgi:hypothetical protein
MSLRLANPGGSAISVKNSAALGFLFLSTHHALPKPGLF